MHIYIYGYKIHEYIYIIHRKKEEGRTAKRFKSKLSVRYYMCRVFTLFNIWAGVKLKSGGIFSSFCVFYAD